MRNGRYILAVGTILAVLLAADALAAGSYQAQARRPAYNSSALELVGNGLYRSDSKHKTMRVTVCLRKRVGKRFFDVRCATASGSGKKIKGQVSVPGCVAGAWKTTVVGEALDRNGSLLNQSSAASHIFRC
jgi:hypothetical protein